MLAPEGAKTMKVWKSVHILAILLNLYFETYSKRTYDIDHACGRQCKLPIVAHLFQIKEY